MILNPVYCEGVEALGHTLHETMPNHRRVPTVLELSATAQAAQAWLAKAPAIRRARAKGQVNGIDDSPLSARQKTTPIGVGYMSADHSRTSGAVTRLGDLWELGQHKFLCADATFAAASYETLLGDDSASMIFTDPP